MKSSLVSSSGYAPAAATNMRHIMGRVANSQLLLPRVSIVRIEGKQKKKLTIPRCMIFSLFLTGISDEGGAYRTPGCRA
jgi:hypothetical protein